MFIEGSWKEYVPGVLRCSKKPTSVVGEHPFPGQILSLDDCTPMFPIINAEKTKCNCFIKFERTPLSPGSSDLLVSCRTLV